MSLINVSVEVSKEVHVSASHIGSLVRDIKKAADDGLDLGDIGPISASIMSHAVPFVKELSATIAAAKDAPLAAGMGFLTVAYETAKYLAPAEEVEAPATPAS